MPAAPPTCAERGAARRRLLYTDAVRYRAAAPARAFDDGIEAGVRTTTVATGALPSPALRDTMTGHTYSVFAIVCTVQDGRPVAVTGSQDGTVRIWDPTAGRCIDRIPLPTPCTALAWGSTDHLFVAFDRDVAVLRRKPYGRNEGPARRTGIVRVSRASGQDGP